VEKFFVFFFRPFCLLDTWIEPFVPTGFALFRCFTDEEGGYTGPLVHAIFTDCRFEDFILGVLPDTPFDYKRHCHTAISLVVVVVEM
jgi:hypothetical protein